MVLCWIDGERAGRSAGVIDSQIPRVAILRQSKSSHMDKMAAIIVEHNFNPSKTVMEKSWKKNIIELF